MNKSFGQLLKELRRSKPISQRDLADKVGVDFSYISKIENDRLPPPAAQTIEKISDALEIPHEILLTHSGKVSEEIKEMITSSPEVVQFLKEVRTLNLSGADWKKLSIQLKQFK